MTVNRRPGGLRLHLRTLDTSIHLELSGSRAAELASVVVRVWSRSAAVHRHPDESSSVVHLSLVLDDDPAVVASARSADLASGDLVEVMHRLSPLVTVRCINAQAGRLLMLHAGAVADPATGHTVGLVGPSGAGKTTAVRKLASTLGYVTDETLAVRADGSIAAHPKPLSIQVTGASFKTQESPDDLGLGATPGAPHLTGVVVLARDGSERAWVERLPTARALAALAPETSYLSRLPRPLHRLAAAIGDDGLLPVVHYGDREHLPPVVQDVLSAGVGVPG